MKNIIKTDLIKSAVLITFLLTATGGALAQATFTNAIGMHFVKIPAGSFVMGSCPEIKNVAGSATRDRQDKFLDQTPAAAIANDCPEGRRVGIGAGHDERPRHKVELKAFWLGSTEVTLGQFKLFIKEKNRRDLVTDGFIAYNSYATQGDEHPVSEVSWLHAQDFIKWLNEKEGGGYRLPSESEWEYACLAGGEQKNCDGNSTKYKSRKRPVKSEAQPSRWGLYNMSDNVSEWVQDTFQPDYKGAPSNGTAWELPGEKMERVVRGQVLRAEVRASQRDSRHPKDSSASLGFRVARDL